MSSLVKSRNRSFLRKQESRKTNEKTGFPLKNCGNDGNISNVALLLNSLLTPKMHLTVGICDCRLFLQFLYFLLQSYDFYSNHFNAGTERNLSIGIPSPPTSNFRFGLKLRSNSSIPGRLPLLYPLLISIATSVLFRRRIKSTSLPRSRQ